MPTDDRPGSALTGIESLMWRLGGEPDLSAAFGSLSILETVPDRNRLDARIARAARAVPRLRRRVAPSTLPGRPPTWADDTDLDLRRHLRWTELDGADASEHALLALAARRVATPFDPAHPPWDMEVLTGLPGGRAALLQRMHHVVADGIGGIRLSQQYLDSRPDAPDPVPDPFVGDDAAPAGSPLERAVVRAGEQLGGAARSLVAATRWTAEGLADPGRFGEAGAAAFDAVDSLRRQVLVTGPPRSPLWAERSGERAFVVASAPFQPVRDVATRTGVSVNAVFVTAVLRGAASYHRAHDEPLEELRVAVPVSTRDDRRAAGNAFAPVRLVLPTGDALAAPAHLRRVARALDAVVHDRSPSLLGQLAGLGDLVPAGLLGDLVRRQTASTDLVCSNVRAAPFPLYVAGARVVSTHALGPLVGTPVNVTMMTYDGRVDLGIHVDTAAVDRPELLRDALVGSLEELVTTA